MKQREEAKLGMKLGEKRMASLKDSGSPGSYTGGTTHPFSGASEDQPCPQQEAQVGMAVMTLLAASSSVSLSPVLHPTSLILHRERALAVLLHDGKTVQKALQARLTLTGRDWAPFLLSQEIPSSLQDGKALAGDQESGNQPIHLVFKGLW